MEAGLVGQSGRFGGDFFALVERGKPLPARIKQKRILHFVLDDTMAREESDPGENGRLAGRAPRAESVARPSKCRGKQAAENAKICSSRAKALLNAWILCRCWKAATAKRLGGLVGVARIVARIGGPREVPRRCALSGCTTRGKKGKCKTSGQKQGWEGTQISLLAV
jgi:hypothetical protein